MKRIRKEDVFEVFNWIADCDSELAVCLRSTGQRDSGFSVIL